MSRAAVILRNVASNWAGFAVNAAVTLVLTPFVLHELGVARYGIWILTSSIIGYYGLLDLGFRAGVNQYLTRYLALKDYEKAGECLSTAVTSLSALGLVMVMLSVAAAYIAPHFFQFPTDLKREAFWCILIVGLTSAIQFSLCAFAAMFSATQRFDLANLIGIATRLLTAGAILLALKMDTGLIGVSLATCLASLLDNLIRWRVSRRLVPQLHVSPRRFRSDRLREIYSFGLWNFLISINGYVCNYVPNLLIGTFMPVAAVGHYALSNGLSRQVNAVLGPIGQVMYPAATAMHSRGDHDGLERLYQDGSRLMMLVMIPTLLLAGFWAEDFFRLWIGQSYLSGEPFQSVAVLFQVLLVGVFTTYFSNIGAQILSGSGRVRVVAITLICGSLFSVTSSVILIRYLGLLGVALSVVMASVLVDLIAMPLLIQRFLGLSIRGYLVHACARPFAALVFQAAGVFLLRLMHRPMDWWSLIWQGAAAVLWMASVALVIGTTAEEREKFLVRPLRRVLGREPRTA